MAGDGTADFAYLEEYRIELLTHHSLIGSSCGGILFAARGEKCTTGSKIDPRGGRHADFQILVRFASHHTLWPSTERDYLGFLAFSSCSNLF